MVFLFIFFFNLEFINKSRSLFPPFLPPTLEYIYTHIYVCVRIINNTRRGSLTQSVLKSWAESGLIFVCFEEAGTGSQGELG